MALLFLLGSAAIISAESDPLPEKVGLRCELLVMGSGGTRSLSTRRLVLQPGMDGRLRFDLPAGSSGRNAPARLLLALSSTAGADGVLLLDVQGEVSEPGEDESRSWSSGRQVALRMGTSALVEVAPEDDGGRRLALSITAESAEDEDVSATLSRVDLDVEVAAVQGEDVVVLEHPRMRSLTSQTVTFAVDYQVPAVSGETFEHVRLDIELTPGFPRGGRLPLDIVLTGDFPGGGPAGMTRRSDSRLLRPGETWEMEMQPPGGQAPLLRLRIMALWQQKVEENDGTGR